MITANEARNLAGPTIDERVEDAGKVIEEAAKAKKRKVALHDPFWVNGGYSKSDDWKQGVAKLEKLGFKVSFYYEERQFVDMYTIVEW